MNKEIAEPFRAPVGMHDVLPPESTRWAGLVDTFARRAQRYGYGLVLTPIVEHLEVFQRVGEETDVVRKEMYDFSDRGGRQLALRPEGTAPVVRAFVQHHPPTPWKVWYAAPHFRYERPQKGRYRQHHQLGVEALGSDDPDLDVEVIDLAHGFLRDLGLRQVTLLINSLGDRHCRPPHLDALRAYLREHASELCEDSRQRLESNPLRVLDCKRAECIVVTEKAPQLLEHLCDECRVHFEQVEHGLASIGIAYEIAPRLVRGLDYYSRTTFELTSDALDAAQRAVGGGGRYDGLVEEMGGPPTPGIGFGLGIERLLIAADAEGLGDAVDARPDVFVVAGPESGEVSRVTHELREAGLRVERAYGGRSVKAQWRAADRARARYVVMLGRDEMERGAVAVKDLAGGEQVEVTHEQLAGWLMTHLEESSS